MKGNLHGYIANLTTRRDVLMELIDDNASNTPVLTYVDGYRARVAEIDRIIDELQATLAAYERRQMFYIRKLVRYVASRNPSELRRQRLLTYRRQLSTINGREP